MTLHVAVPINRYHSPFRELTMAIRIREGSPPSGFVARRPIPQWWALCTPPLAVIAQSGRRLTLAALRTHPPTPVPSARVSLIVKPVVPIPSRGMPLSMPGAPPTLRARQLDAASAPCGSSPCARQAARTRPRHHGARQARPARLTTRPPGPEPAIRTSDRVSAACPRFVHCPGFARSARPGAPWTGPVTPRVHPSRNNPPRPTSRHRLGCVRLSVLRSSPLLGLTRRAPPRPARTRAPGRLAPLRVIPAGVPSVLIEARAASFPGRPPSHPGRTRSVATPTRHFPQSVRPACPFIDPPGAPWRRYILRGPPRAGFRSAAIHPFGRGTPHRTRRPPRRLRCHPS